MLRQFSLRELFIVTAMVAVCVKYNMDYGQLVANWLYATYCSFTIDLIRVY